MVYISENGYGTIEDCNIFANKQAGVHIIQGGNPMVRKCKIHGSREGAGVCVMENGQGTIESCDIFGNNRGPIYVERGCRPAIRNCKQR